jgi:hypothetical protein
MMQNFITQEALVRNLRTISDNNQLSPSRFFTWLTDADYSINKMSGAYTVIYTKLLKTADL